MISSISSECSVARTNASGNLIANVSQSYRSLAVLFRDSPNDGRLNLDILIEQYSTREFRMLLDTDSPAAVWTGR